MHPDRHHGTDIEPFGVSQGVGVMVQYVLDIIHFMKEESFTLWQSNMAGWKIPELNGGFKISS